MVKQTLIRLVTAISLFIICEGAWEKGPIGHNNHLEIWALKVALIFTRQ